MASKLLLAFAFAATALAQDPCYGHWPPPACCPMSQMSCPSGAFCPSSPWCGAPEAIQAIEQCGIPAAKCIGTSDWKTCLCALNQCFRTQPLCSLALNETHVADHKLRDFPSIIKKLFCEMAAKKEIEDKSVGEVCQTICSTGILKKMEPLCESTLDKIWDQDVDKVCPKPVQGVRDFPFPKDLPSILEKLFKFYEKMACKMATQKEIEDKSVDAVCKKVCANPLLQKLEKSCETHLDKVWEQTFAHCPKPDQVLDERRMRDLPQIIEKLACMLVGELKGQEVKAVCTEVFASGKLENLMEPVCEQLVGKSVCKEIFSSGKLEKLEPVCEELLGQVLEKALETCPKENEQVLV